MKVAFILFIPDCGDESSNSFRLHTFPDCVSLENLDLKHTVSGLGLSVPVVGL